MSVRVGSALTPPPSVVEGVVVHRPDGSSRGPLRRFLGGVREGGAPCWYRWWCLWRELSLCNGGGGGSGGGGMETFILPNPDDGDDSVRLDDILVWDCGTPWGVWLLLLLLWLS